ncbi:MAG: PLP-dependent lyase/thiolase [Candidatus Heimdallarchaeaceae archaeon]
MVYDETIGCFLKLECYNPSGSHKDRETLYLVDHYGWDKHYIIASTGNAGISLAYWMKSKAHVLVPEITSKEKIKLIKHYGASVIVKGQYYHDCYKLVDKIANENNFINVSPGYQERWRGDIAISGELKEIKPDYVFIPSANHTLAYGIAYGFKELADKGLIETPPMIISCVLPSHPFACLARDIDEKYKRVFSSIYTYSGQGKNIRREFLDFSFTKSESTVKLNSVLKLAKKYPNYDPAVLLAMFISKKYTGKKIIIVTGIKR